MAKKWIYINNGIGVTIENKIVRIANDWALDRFIENKKENAFPIAMKLKEMYSADKGTELKISTKSLAAEIYYHYRLQKITFAIEKKFGRSRATKWMLRHMEIIDCGEGSVDNNRFVWDIASKFWKDRSKTD